MNCADLDRWLDEGMPAGASADAAVHAAGCPACAATLAAMREVASALAPGPECAPARFAEAVLARIDSEPARAPAALIPVSPLPWWAAASRDPITVLAFAALGSLCIAGRQVAAAAAARAEGAVELLLSAAGFVWGSPALLAVRESLTAAVNAPHGNAGGALVLAAWVVPAVAWAAFELWRWTGAGGDRPAR